MKERYCIDRGLQPSTVGPASDRYYHRLHGGSKHASHVCSEHNIFARSVARNPSELATYESHRVGWNMSVRPASDPIE
jgi:hypothetical protein